MSCTEAAIVFFQSFPMHRHSFSDRFKDARPNAGLFVLIRFNLKTYESAESWLSFEAMLLQKLF